MCHFLTLGVSAIKHPGSRRLKPPYTHNIIVNNIDTIKLTVYILATNVTKILINIKFICTSKYIEQ